MQFSTAGGVTPAVFADIVSGAAYGFNIVGAWQNLEVSLGAGQEYNEPGIIGDLTNGELYGTVNQDGIAVGHYDGLIFATTTPIPYVAGTKVNIQVKYNGTHLMCRVNGKKADGTAGWETVAAGNLRPAMLTDNKPTLGAGYPGNNPADGDQSFVMAFKNAPADSVYDDLLDYAVAEHGVVV